MNPAPVRNVQRFSTAGMPVSERLPFWNELAARMYGPLVVDGDRRARFEGEIARLELSGCELTSARSSPVVVRYQRSSSGACAHERSLNLQVQIAGRARAEAGGRAAQLRPGDCMLVDPSAAYSVGFDEPTHILVLRVPRAKLIERGLVLDSFVGERVAGDQGATPMLFEFMRNLFGRIDRFEEAWSQPTSEILFTLLEMVYRPGARVPEATSAPKKLLERVKERIELELCDPGFEVLSVARLLDVTPRYVQLLFARSGMTPSRYVLQRRLELAAARLRTDPSSTISTIAFAVGFNDLSYFTRAFRRRYGMSAREYRARRAATSLSA